MNIYSSTKQGFPTTPIFDGLTHTVRIEQLRMQLLSWDFPIPFTTRFFPEHWLAKTRPDGGYSMEII